MSFETFQLILFVLFWMLDVKIHDEIQNERLFRLIVIRFVLLIFCDITHPFHPTSREFSWNLCALTPFTKHVYSNRFFF